jgi:hypothetical protein
MLNNSSSWHSDRKYSDSYCRQMVYDLRQTGVVHCNQEKRTISLWVPIPVAERSKTWVCGRWLAGIVDSNPAGGAWMCLSVVSVVCRQVEVSALG